MNAARLPIFLIAYFARAIFCAENPIALQTELKLQSVGVAVRAPLGWRYHPGELFPLEVFIDNPGPPVRGAVELTEGAAGGSDGFAERAVLPGPVVFPSGRSRHVLSVRAGPVSSGLLLRIQSKPADESGGSELFRVPLSRLSTPLPVGGRMIVQCGGAFSSAPRGPDDVVAQISARELPDEAWMWEGVDWLVLNDASIKEARPEAREALTGWLLGGGRIFLGSREALAAGHALNLLPLPADMPLESGTAWWEKNAGLQHSDILAEKNFRPVYARVKMGFGQVVFLFPGAESADANGAAVFNRADLQRPHLKVPDERVQPERFEMFAPDSLNRTRALGVMFWSLVGALLFCAALFYAQSSKSWVEAALTPFAAGGLAIALLANGFPAANLSVSRVRISTRSQDGRGLTLEDWNLLEAFQHPLKVDARALGQAALMPIYGESEDLNSGGISRSAESGRIELSGISVAPSQPALLRASETFGFDSNRNSVPEEKLVYNFSGAQTHLNMPANYPPATANKGRLLSIDAVGQVLLLKRDSRESEFSAEVFDISKREAEHELKLSGGMSAGRRLALKWALEKARLHGGGALIGWDEVDGARDIVPLVEFEGVTARNGAEFWVRIQFVSQAAR